MRNTKTSNLTIMALMTAVLLIFACTPIGTIPIGPLSISMNMIPVAICAVAMGPAGGAVAGAIFGLLSFLQCFGIGIPSGMGIILVGINPFLAFIQRFVPRLLDGLLLGYIFRAVSKKNVYLACAVTGFFSAFLNTVFFMTALVLLFGNTEYVQGLIAGRNIIVFICAFVGVNAVVEMVVATLITGAVGSALFRAKVLSR
ncbi:Pantothenic acid ECF transporter S component PanT [uncultured Clostridium sp.]|uniref:ECF transporter S component n=1 Tax=Muricoprocola aceti TaxID=2981772 RepID=A0ABT2SQB8_9FIRM|nr:ECF transporter S component [Muricoprocola aceti]MCU6726676.1 ECF transporter S component [Muricoprocola aceti]SCH99072.1 Pantothenic acid ECF transporter S component PanT [uncultured Clostridium sp.]